MLVFLLEGSLEDAGLKSAGQVTSCSRGLTKCLVTMPIYAAHNSTKIRSLHGNVFVRIIVLKYHTNRAIVNFVTVS